MRSVDRPIRLHALTILIVIAYGILPFVSAFFVDRQTVWLVGLRNLPLNGSIALLNGPNGESHFVLVFVSLFLCVFTAASAFWAYSGEPLGRFAVLAFLTADVLWWSGIVVYALAYSDADGAAKLGWALQLIAPPIWLGAIWWNFTRPDLNVYYEFKSRSSA